MGTDPHGFCLDCGASPEKHQRQWEESALHLSVLLRAKEHGYSDELDSIISTWRWHALPPCDPLALS